MDVTPYKEIDGVLETLLSKIKIALREKLVGFYLYGSLAAGDFDYLSSDIDFVAVTANELDDEVIAKLRQIHEEIYNQPGRWNKELEGAYISVEALRRYDPNSQQPFVNGDETLRLTKLGPDWIINRHILREKGLALYGPPASNFIDPIAKEEIIHAVKDELRLSWKPTLSNQEKMKTRLYQAFSILTMCRALYALKWGEVVSKIQAARWAKKTLEPKWARLIDWALIHRHDPTVDKKSLPQALSFTHWVVGRGRVRTSLLY
jgi:predicted nucleotidyltransferase